jgi:hypothetical protein
MLLHSGSICIQRQGFQSRLPLSGYRSHAVCQGPRRTYLDEPCAGHGDFCSAAFRSLPFARQFAELDEFIHKLTLSKTSRNSGYYIATVFSRELDEPCQRELPAPTRAVARVTNDADSDVKLVVILSDFRRRRGQLETGLFITFFEREKGFELSTAPRRTDKQGVLGSGWMVHCSPTELHRLYC